MLSLPFLSVVVAILGIVWWFRLSNGRKGSKPIPGPWGLPLLGNVLQVGALMHLKFSEWAETYGDVFQIKLGSRTAVIISDPKLVKDIFTTDPAFAGRSFFEGFEMYENERLGIVASEGDLWLTHRRFLLRQLRDFGFGKSSMEQLIMEEVKETINRFNGAEGKPLGHTKEIFEVAVINSLWMVVSGKRFKHDDPSLLEMMADGHRLTKELMRRSVTFFVPWTRHFLPKLTDWERIRERNRQFYESAINEHKESFNKDDPRDFVDVYLAEMEAEKNNPSSTFYGSRAERQLAVILADLHFAGSDTTSATLGWALLYLSKFPKVQEKLQKEITEVTGDTRFVSVSDRPNMPYALGVIEETLRYSSIVPSGVQHRAIEGKEFKGYYIPEDSWIFPNLYHIHFNPKIWGDPQNFRPERFVSADGTFKKNENLMAFQIGRRQCVGETLARDSIFLFLTNIFQRFSVSLDPNTPEPGLEPLVGFVLAPQPYSVILQDRNK